MNARGGRLALAVAPYLLAGCATVHADLPRLAGDESARGAVFCQEIDAKSRAEVQARVGEAAAFWARAAALVEPGDGDPTVRVWWVSQERLVGTVTPFAPLAASLVTSMQRGESTADGEKAFLCGADGHEDAVRALRETVD
jgi:hypothetical protein